MGLVLPVIVPPDPSVDGRDDEDRNDNAISGQQVVGSICRRAIRTRWTSCATVLRSESQRNRLPRSRRQVSAVNRALRRGRDLQDMVATYQQSEQHDA